jgi:hypothetical protein
VVATVRLARHLRAGVLAVLVAAPANAYARGDEPPIVPLPVHAQTAEPDPCRRLPTFGDAMHDWARIYFEAVYLVTDLFLPDVGFRYDTRSGSAFVLAWPWAFPFGPASAREVERHRCRADTVYELVPYRLVVEAGLSIGDEATGWVRPGYSVVWHPKASRFGVMLGIGPTFVLRHGQREILSSFELGVRHGACCRPGYSALTTRYERTVWGSDGAEAEAVLLKIGLLYW